jgi:hypothetical protein
VYKPLDLDFLFHAPTGYANPRTFVHTSGRSEGEFMEYYGGGWQDLLPFAGNEPLKHRFGEWGMHGESALLPWDAKIENQTPSSVTAKLTLQLRRYPFRVEKWITMNDRTAALQIREKVTNTSDQALEYCWLQHLIEVILYSMQRYAHFRRQFREAFSSINFQFFYDLQVFLVSQYIVHLALRRGQAA